MADVALEIPSVRCRTVALRQTPLDLSDLEPFRRELTGYCYRMLGSGFEAEDAVQETMLRAWRHAEGFEGRSSIRSWLYRIATNVCIDMHRQVQRRAMPMEMGPASPPVESLLGPTLPEATWVTPVPDALVAPHGADPAEIVQYRESIRLAFVTALQHLPARQRAALILCEVLRWQVSEVAELLDTSVAAVNSALQRARATLRSLSDETEPEALDGADTELLALYVDAFERYDIERLVTLLREDAVQSMPPFAMWIRGAADIGRWMVEPGPSECRGSRLVPASANGCPAFGQYRLDPAGGYTPWALQVLEISAGKITGMTFFLSLLDPERLFPEFGLPLHLDA
jgi:RNA polymerase sigma-70 factor (ECF subfamily)